MDENVINFHKKFLEVAVDCQKFCFMSRAKELQKEAKNKLDDLYNETHILKLDLISQKDEDAANALLSMELTIQSLQGELSMWIALKEDNPGSAWDFLVDAQRDARDALRVHLIGERLVGYIQHLDLLEIILFPRQMFSSVGMIVSEAVCSICGEEYGECNHLKGKAYMGEMCVRIIKHIASLEEVSIVDNPANKHCRITSFTEEGIVRDILTWRVVEKDPNHVVSEQSEQNVVD
jgi:hypothetical protein